MDIIFDDSFKFLSNFQKHKDEIPMRISSLGPVITERNIRLAVMPHTASEWNRYKAAIPADRTVILHTLLSDPTIPNADKEWFQNKIQTMGDPSGGGGGGWGSGDLQGQAIDEANIVGEAGADVGSVLKLKEAVLARLRMRGIPDQQINDILVLFMEKVMLPFSETIKVLDHILEESLKARANVVDMIEFWAYHYNEKRSQGLTNQIMTEAVKLQELNPTLNIFNLLKNAAIGNQAEVGKVILIKDPDARLVVNNLISLTQSALPEQAEQVRRDFQFSRDAMLNYMDKLRIQKALFDMMKTEEMNRNVTSYIADTSAIFKSLVTQPMFRALRDVFYDLQASKILLNQYSALVTDTQPLVPRVTPREEQLSPGEGMFPYPNNPQRIGSRFVPLKKNNIVTAQTPITVGTGAPSAITNPGTSSPASLQTGTSAITGQQTMTGVNTAPQTQGSLGYASRPDPAVAVGFLSGIKKKLDEEISKVVPGLQFVFHMIGEGILQIIDAVKQGVTNILQTVEKIFTELGGKIFNYIKEGVAKGVNFVSNVFNPKQASSEFVTRLAQYSPQTTTRGYGDQKWYGSIASVVAVLVIALGSRSIFTALRTLASPPLYNISEVVNLILPGVLGIKNLIFEFVYQWNPSAGNQAPTSAQYYDKGTRRFSAEGLRRLYNNQQTRVSLGIAAEEDLALSRAEKQRSENMATVRTQLEILQKAMDQSVYLGGKTDVAPANVPNELQNKINIFLKFCKSVQDANQAEYLILKKAIDRVSAKFDPAQKIQAQNLLASVRNDMASLQSTIAEYSSSAIVMDHIQRKRKLMMTLGPTLKRMQALESLGISKASLITGKNGVLQQLSRIRHEEASALQKLRKEYMEKMQLLDRPDIAQKEFAFPVDTTAVRLPLPPLPPTTPTSA